MNKESKNVTNLNGWYVQVSECRQYLYVMLDGAPGAIHIKAEDEGFVVDIWATTTDDEPLEAMATTSAFYTELEPE